MAKVLGNQQMTTSTKGNIHTHTDKRSTSQLLFPGGSRSKHQTAEAWLPSHRMRQRFGPKKPSLACKASLRTRLQQEERGLRGFRPKSQERK